ncbi:IclR family transcriptional regulator [Arthrobacter sp. Helios]|uniref:IclR family transcriptional regulator n=1 Tax=Arthrobacter sp. Helios TaxID=2828862 RepID=UPI0020690D14|nr:IclR family transcriptional regulator [Arthrobacter sp. Helios]UPO78127.1 IclR family transcriptional regulator [Arthrobacter sp. Helios]
MQNIRIVKKPGYAVDAADRALQLILLLQETEWLRIGEAAKALGVAPSTAHRLMSTLVYRGFALQDDQHRYCAGPALHPEPAASAERALIAAARPHLEELAAAVQETVNLVERVGATARYLATVEGPQLLRVGNRAGTILPAHVSAAGKAILSTLPDHMVSAVCSRQAPSGGSALSADAVMDLLAELDEVRRLGFAVNLGRTEPDLAAVGAPLSPGNRPAVLAVSLSAPLSRAAQIQDPASTAALVSCCRSLLLDLQAQGHLPAGKGA